MHNRNILHQVLLKMMPIIKILEIRQLTFIAIFLFYLVMMQLTDPDYFWHLKTGEYIVNHLALPHGDIFSYTKFGAPWVLHEWLFEALLYGASSWMGLLGIKLLTASLATTVVCVTYSLLRHLTASTSIAFVLLLLAFIPFSLGVSPRPQLITYIFFITFLYVLLTYKYELKSYHFLTLPLMMLVWVNAHGGFMLGLALLWLFVVCEWLGYFIDKERDQTKNQRLKTLTLVALATMLTSTINPEFIGHWLYPFKVMSMEANRNISEWHSPDFHDFSGQTYLALVLFFVISSIYATRKPDLTEIVVPTLLMTFGFVAARNVPLASLTLVIFTGISLSRGPIAWLSSYWQQAGMLMFYKKWVGGGKQLGMHEYFLNWLLLLVILIASLIFYPIYHAKDEDKYNEFIPVKAAEFIVKQGITGRMFNTYGFGGYLIYRLNPTHKVFIDGRADMYGDAFFKEYLQITRLQPGWKNTFDQYKIDYVIMERSEPLCQFLQANNEFKLIYDDQYNSVLVRNSLPSSSLIKKN
jgi:hypothetical protein